MSKVPFQEWDAKTDMSRVTITKGQINSDMIKWIYKEVYYQKLWPVMIFVSLLPLLNLQTLARKLKPFMALVCLKKFPWVFKNRLSLKRLDTCSSLVLVKYFTFIGQHNPYNVKPITAQRHVLHHHHLITAEGQQDHPVCLQDIHHHWEHYRCPPKDLKNKILDLF